tara:strand:- start:416 stop:649 length:234 start_codon:yes stop_codon:yes gene_type:complete
MNCVELCEKAQQTCCNSECRYWINYEKDLNCTIVCVKKNGAMTLQETSKRIGLSYVRIKQIQDKAMKKINKEIIKNS